MSKVRDLDYYVVKAIRANAAVNSSMRPEAQNGGRKTLAEIYAQLSKDPEQLAQVTALATQRSGGNFSWRV